MKTQGQGIEMSRTMTELMFVAKWMKPGAGVCVRHRQLLSVPTRGVQALDSYVDQKTSAFDGVAIPAGALMPHARGVHVRFVMHNDLVVWVSVVAHLLLIVCHIG